MNGLNYETASPLRAAYASSRGDAVDYSRVPFVNIASRILARLLLPCSYKSRDTFVRSLDLLSPAQLDEAAAFGRHRILGDTNVRFAPIAGLPQMRLVFGCWPYAIVDCARSRR